jgi:hypothetical protein
VLDHLQPDAVSLSLLRVLFGVALIHLGQFHAFTRGLLQRLDEHANLLRPVLLGDQRDAQASRCPKLPMAACSFESFSRLTPS